MQWFLKLIVADSCEILLILTANWTSIIKQSARVVVSFSKDNTVFLNGSNIFEIWLQSWKKPREVRIFLTDWFVIIFGFSFII